MLAKYVNFCIKVVSNAGVHGWAKQEERLSNSKFKEPFLMDLDTKRFMFSIQRIMKSSVSELGFTSQIEREKYSRFLFVTKRHALDH